MLGACIVGNHGSRSQRVSRAQKPYRTLTMCGHKHADVGQAFQPAGGGDIPVPTAFHPADWKVRFTGRLESLPCSRTRHRTHD